MGFGATAEEAAEAAKAKHVAASLIGGGAQHSTIVNVTLAAIVIGFLLLTALEPYFTNFMARPIGKSC